MAEQQLLSNRLKRLESFDSDVLWFQNNYGVLKRRFKGNYVAIKGKKVIDHDRDPVVLIGRLRKKYGNTSTIAIEFVNQHNIKFLL